MTKTDETMFTNELYDKAAELGVTTFLRSATRQMEDDARDGRRKRHPTMFSLPPEITAPYEVEFYIQMYVFFFVTMLKIEGGPRYQNARGTKAASIWAEYHVKTYGDLVFPFNIYQSVCMWICNEF